MLSGARTRSLDQERSFKKWAFSRYIQTTSRQLIAATVFNRCIASSQASSLKAGVARVVVPDHPQHVPPHRATDQTSPHARQVGGRAGRPKRELDCVHFFNSPSSTKHFMA